MDKGEIDQVVRAYLDDIDAYCQRCDVMLEYESKLSYKGIIELPNTDGTVRRLVQAQCTNCGVVHFFDLEFILGE